MVDSTAIWYGCRCRPWASTSHGYPSVCFWWFCSLIEHEDVLFIVYAAWQLSFYERCDPVFGKIGRFVFTSGERLRKLRIWEHSSQDVTNDLVRFEGIMSAHNTSAFWVSGGDTKPVNAVWCEVLATDAELFSPLLSNNTGIGVVPLAASIGYISATSCGTQELLHGP